MAGLSEHIKVRSIVGRWLEHSRVYYFGDGSPTGDLAGGVWLIGSADMMDRNLNRRVESLVPIESTELQGRLQEIVETELADDVRAWELAPDGCWHKLPPVAGIDAHQRLQDLAVARARRRIESEVMPAR